MKGYSKGSHTDQVGLLGSERHRVAGLHLETHVVHLAFDVQEWAALARRANDVQFHTVSHVLHLQVEGIRNGEVTEGKLMNGDEVLKR